MRILSMLTLLSLLLVLGTTALASGFSPAPDGPLVCADEGGDKDDGKEEEEAEPECD